MSKYGLIVPNKNKSSGLVFEASKNVFGDGSDSDEESKKPVKLRPSDLTNRQAKTVQEKAVLEDPTVYQYDEIYDSMTTKIQEEKNKTKAVKKPRYIENLLKTANKRKLENERRKERQIQKEREKEGEEFADKEVFVTSAYKKKLEELREEEEKEKREEYLESIGDVTKQKDLGGFYRHLYEQKLGTKTESKNSDNTLPTEEETNEHSKKTKIKNDDVVKSSRNYRKRNAGNGNNELSEGEIEDSEEEDVINRVNLQDIKEAKKTKLENLDADSDFSIDESSDEDNDKQNVESFNNFNKDVGHTKSSSRETDQQTHVTVSKQGLRENVPTIADDNTNDVHKEEVKIEEVKIKINIWEKRTVGKVFDEALKRYFERKAAR